MRFSILPFPPDDESLVLQAGQLLAQAFREHWPLAWPTPEDGVVEVRELLQPGRILRMALSGDGRLVGLIGGLSQYDGHVWELHPLAVDPPYQGLGIGRSLVMDFEEQVRAHGGSTIYLGTDDEDNMTSLAGRDLYADPFEQIRAIRNIKGHPFEFYQKLGYTIIGVMPDANGFGKPDILMAKRVRR